MAKPQKKTSDEFERVIERAVEKYMREMKRIRIRYAIIAMCEDQGLPIPEGEEMEALIDEGETYLTDEDEAPAETAEKTENPPDANLPSKEQS